MTSFNYLLFSTHYDLGIILANEIQSWNKAVFKILKAYSLGADTDEKQL